MKDGTHAFRPVLLHQKDVCEKDCQGVFIEICLVIFLKVTFSSFWKVFVV